MEGRVSRSVLALVAGLSFVGACSHSSRGTALVQFTRQLESKGGVTHDQAFCIATKFFAPRTDQELAAFFARPELTEPEQVEFARLGDECGVAPSTTP